jgi:hypothetical protein
MNFGMFLMTLLIGWAWAAHLEMRAGETGGPKLIGPWALSDLIRRGVAVFGALVGGLFLSAIPEELIKDKIFADDVMVVAMGALLGAVVAVDALRIVMGLLGGMGGLSNLGSMARRGPGPQQ